MEQFEFDLDIPTTELPESAGDKDPNPMCRKVGYGPDGAQCKTCKHLIQKVVHSQTKFYKCLKQCRKNKYTGSLEGRDYRLKWNACRLYEEATND